MNEQWHKLTEKLPENKVDAFGVPLEYFCIIYSQRHGKRSIRAYRFWDGHFWNGPGIMDNNILAWMERPEPPEES